jgi:hypothetical protein
MERTGKAFGVLRHVHPDCRRPVGRGSAPLSRSHGITETNRLAPIFPANRLGSASTLHFVPAGDDTRRLHQRFSKTCFAEEFRLAEIAASLEVRA